MSSLDAYLAEFSGVGAVPTSLGGYGYGQRVHDRELRGLGAAAPNASAAINSTAKSGNMTVSTAAIQGTLINLGVPATGLTDGKFGKTTKTAWEKAARSRPPSGSLNPYIDGAVGAKSVTVNTATYQLLVGDAQATLNDNAAKKAAAVAPAASKPLPSAASTPTPLAAKAKPASPVAAAPSAPATATPAVVSKGDLVANTSDVQSLLKRLGWSNDAIKSTFGAKPGALDDGIYGTTVREAWTQSATKRKLDAFIAKKSADGRQVTVRESTYLQLKAAADAVVPPQTGTAAPAPIGGSLLTLSSALVSKLTVAQLNDVLGRLAGAPAGATQPLPNLMKLYAAAAKAAKVDPRIEESAGGVVVLKTAWNAFMKKYDKLSPSVKKPATGAQKTDEEKALAIILKEATVSTPVDTVRSALNLAVMQGVMKREPFASGVWEDALREPLLDLLAVTDVQKRGWFAAAFVVGKLVSKDGKTIKLPPPQAAQIKKWATQLAQLKKADLTAPTGFTAVNTAEIIAKVNGLNVSTALFNRNGGAKEMADAIRTFLENTQSTVPSGDFVKTDAKQNVYVQNDVLVTLANAVKEAEARAAATTNYRGQMVDNALRDSSATVSALDIQQAVAATLASGNAGPNAALYSTVQQTGVFDTATRAAYTLLAQTLTIGAAVLEAEKLLKAQMGANYKVALTEEIRNKVWGEFLDRAIVGNNVQVMPVIAQTITDAAAAYRNASATAGAPPAAQAVTQAQTDVLTNAINASTKVVSVLNAQQALLQMAANKEIDAVAGLAVTGISDQPTGNALYWVSGMIFPEGYKLPETAWGNYLNSVGLNVVSDSNVSKGWPNANYIGLPPAVADLLIKRAGEYLYGHGPAQVQVASYSRAATVTAAAPAAAPAAEQAPATGQPDMSLPSSPQPAASAPVYAAPAPVLAPVSQPTPATPGVTGPAPQVVDFSQDAQAQQPLAPLPAAPAPTPDAAAPAPTPDAAPAPAESSNLGLYLLGGAAALAALLAFKSKDKGSEKKQQMRYARP